jgi:hypothetical protein
MVEMVLLSPAFSYVAESAGTTFTGSNGITIVSDQGAAAYLGQPAYFRAHVVAPGSRGNMSVRGFYAIDKPTPSSATIAEFYNTTAFTGGQDAGSYAFVQQNDITAGEQALTPTVKQSTLAALNAKASSNDQWASAPTCTPNATADETPGQRVQNFHVTVTVNCSGEV